MCTGTVPAEPVRLDREADDHIPVLVLKRLNTSECDPFSHMSPWRCGEAQENVTIVNGTGFDVLEIKSIFEINFI
jgi:hypothetical protein